jgi:hypothetical protein
VCLARVLVHGWLIWTAAEIVKLARLMAFDLLAGETRPLGLALLEALGGDL